MDQAVCPQSGPFCLDGSAGSAQALHVIFENRSTTPFARITSTSDSQMPRLHRSSLQSPGHCSWTRKPGSILRSSLVVRTHLFDARYCCSIPLDTDRNMSCRSVLRSEYQSWERLTGIAWTPSQLTPRKMNTSGGFYMTKLRARSVTLRGVRHWVSSTYIDIADHACLPRAMVSTPFAGQTKILRYHDFH